MGRRKLKPQMDTDEHRLNKISFAINGCAMEVLNEIGHGFHEKIYENALAVAFINKGLNFSQQKRYDINFLGKVIGTFIPDFVVEDSVILEIKTIERITNHEKGQALNYLRASNLGLGLILNFKHAKLEWHRVIL